MKAKSLLPPTLTLTLKKTIGSDENGDPIIETLEPIRMRVLTISEWWEIGTGVYDPAVPMDAKGKPNPQDMDYRRKLQEAEAERNYRRLAAACDIKGGIEFEGQKLEDKADELREFDPAIYIHLFNELYKQVTGRQVAVTSDSFRENGS